jgi:AraC-type DNA-binding domain-containing proteins
MSGVVCEKRIYDDRIITHKHDYAQLVIPLFGEMDVNLEKNHCSVGINDIYLLPHATEHSFFCNGNNEFLITDIPSYYFILGKYKLDNGIKCSLDEKWKAIRFLLLDEYDRKSGENEAVAKLCHYLLPELLNRVVPKSVCYILDHFNENITLETLARIEGYSVNYYSEWFKKVLGKLPVEYIHELRIGRAKELLRDTSLSIMQITRMVGYTYESSFTKRFTSLEKISPKAYRMYAVQSF